MECEGDTNDESSSWAGHYQRRKSGPSVPRQRLTTRLRSIVFVDFPSVPRVRSSSGFLRLWRSIGLFNGCDSAYVA